MSLFGKKEWYQNSQADVYVVERHDRDFGLRHSPYAPARAQNITYM